MSNTKPRYCPWDGEQLIKPRINQTYCSAGCRRAHADAQKNRNDKPPVRVHTCPECDENFDTDNPDKEFCSSTCQQAFNNFWKGKGPSLARAIHQWRVNRTKGGMNAVCREFSKARKAHKQRRADKKELPK